MNAPQITGNPFHLIDIICLKLSSAQARKYRVVKTLMGQQRLVIKFERCRNGNIVIQQIVGKLMLFLNLFCGPALWPVKLYDKALALFVLKLVDTVFVAV